MNFLPSKIKIGLFDSGIGGFSILNELFALMPYATYFYISDDAHAPYGPKTDEFITLRSESITQTLLENDVDLIVVACNTATAASIDFLREKFNHTMFVGVEPYLNAYCKIPEGKEKKVVVLTTESTGKSERFKRLKDRIDPKSKIDNYSLKNLARIIENHYYEQDNEKLDREIETELKFLIGGDYSYAILGCTHYPLVVNRIEKILNLKAISPCKHIAERVEELIKKKYTELKTTDNDTDNEEFFHFLSSKNNQWIKKNRESLLGPFKGKSL